MENGVWIPGRLAEFLPADMVQQVLAMGSPPGDSPDRMVWTASTSGQFSLASAYSELRECKPSSFLYRQAWYPNVPQKVSFFVLRLLRNHLSLDDILASYDFQLLSKCSYCLIQQIESLGHLFAEGGLAAEVWKFFGSVCGVHLNAGHVRGILGSCWLRRINSERLKLMFQILTSLVYWHIWKAKNKAIFQGSRMNPATVCRDIFKDLKDAYGLVFLELQQLNIDGCLKDNPGVSGGGGILRSTEGRLLFAFSVYLGQCTSLQAEAKALLLGLQLCVQRGCLDNLVVESNSMMLV
nr:uncharacterized protein LOC113693117 [Coffea arabica]